MHTSHVFVKMAVARFNTEMTPMNYFLDTEFEENGETIMPISLALITENDRELYLEFDFDWNRARKNSFVKQNILPYVGREPEVSRYEARMEILRFVGDDPSPVFWAYYADYDWVLLCQLFGRMIDLPDPFPKCCLDLQQWYVQLGKPENAKPQKPREEHNALADAYWNRAFYWNLKRIADGKEEDLKMLDETPDAIERANPQYQKDLAQAIDAARQVRGDEAMTAEEFRTWLKSKMGS
jgi:hypothetical protein